MNLFPVRLGCCSGGLRGAHDSGLISTRALGSHALAMFGWFPVYRHRPALIICSNCNTMLLQVLILAKKIWAQAWQVYFLYSAIFVIHFVKPELWLGV